MPIADTNASARCVHLDARQSIYSVQTPAQANGLLSYQPRLKAWDERETIIRALKARFITALDHQ